MTTRRRSARKLAPPSPDPETYQAGTWSGVPNFVCPYCPYATLDGTALVVAHIASEHRAQLSVAPKEE